MDADYAEEKGDAAQVRDLISQVTLNQIETKISLFEGSTSSSATALGVETRQSLTQTYRR